MANSYKSLKVWQRAVNLANDIYDLTANFPDYEKFGLANQLRRAAVSIPSNLAEGSVKSTKDFSRYVGIARGSVAEIETQMLIAKMRSFISKEEYNKLSFELEEIGRMLVGLQKSLKTENQELRTENSYV